MQCMVQMLTLIPQNVANFCFWYRDQQTDIQAWCRWPQIWCNGAWLLDRRSWCRELVGTKQWWASWARQVNLSHGCSNQGLTSWNNLTKKKRRQFLWFKQGTWLSRWGKSLKVGQWHWTNVGEVGQSLAIAGQSWGCQCGQIRCVHCTCNCTIGCTTHQASCTISSPNTKPTILSPGALWSNF